MKAVVYEKVGGPEVLKVVSMPKPTAGTGEVVVKVKACALNHIDYDLRIEDDDAVPMPHILGSDISGVVESLGEGVTGWSIGDSVMISPSMSCGKCIPCRAGNESLCTSFGILGYQTQGGYAEFIAVPDRNLIHKPEYFSFEEAASIPLVYMTTYHQIITRAHLEAGESILVMGASSGIGSAAIQLSSVVGAFVISTVGDDANAERAKSIGAKVIVNHKKSDWQKEVMDATEGKGVSVVCEHFGGEFFGKCVELLASGGRLMTIGYTAGSRMSLDLSTILRKQVTIGTSYMGSVVELTKALRLLELKNQKPIIAKVFSLEDAQKAHELLQSRRHFGKIVLRVS